MTKYFHNTFDRFMAKVEFDTNGGCWLWSGNAQVYGSFSMGRGRTLSAHRFAWEYFSGIEAPKGMCVCHRCDTPLCVNPDHLWLGTYTQNSLDMVAKGRCKGVPPYRPGSRNGASKLTEEIVAEIKARLRGGVLQNALAREYGVGNSTLNRIAKGTHWRHVT